MIGTIRKHSSWLWWVVAGLTIISFIYWGASPGTRNGSSRYSGYGTIYGKQITAEQYTQAEREFLIYYWQRNHQFPSAEANRLDIERGTFQRLLLSAKATQLGIHVSSDAEVAEANNFLRMLGRDGEPAPMSAFVDRVLTPAGLDVADFQRYIASSLVIDQLIQTLGLSGSLVPPQAAGQLFDRENQEYSVQAVFFSASNYVFQVAATPAAVSQFYTNYMAHYRLPDRVQVNYIVFDLTNFAAAVEQKMGKTNITAMADAEFAKHGMEEVPGAKTPEEAKAKIREMFIRQGSANAEGTLGMAEDKAREFLKPLFAMDPVSGENLVALAKTNGLTVQTTEPFSEEEGPSEFLAPPELIKEAFQLSPDSPFSTKPIVGMDAVYIIGLADKLPSEIPPFDMIESRVTRDYEYHEAAMRARTAGTNFYYSAAVQMAAGQTFAQAATAASQTPFSLKPFSLSTQEIPEVQGHAEVNAIKQTVFTTPVGHVSSFQPTAEGGYVMFVKSLLPVDEKLKSSELPKYLEQLRREHEQEAFNAWLNLEASRELRSTPLAADLAAKQSPGSP
jgi:hypothetical protein